MAFNSSTRRRTPRYSSNEATRNAPRDDETHPSTTHRQNICSIVPVTFDRPPPPLPPIPYHFHNYNLHASRNPSLIPLHRTLPHPRGPLPRLMPRYYPPYRTVFPNPNNYAFMHRNVPPVRYYPNPIYNVPVQPILPPPVVINPAPIRRSHVRSTLITLPVRETTHDILATSDYDLQASFSPGRITGTDSADSTYRSHAQLEEKLDFDESGIINSTMFEDNIIQEEPNDPLNYYLRLPRNLFPPARMLALDPNPLIDEFCKVPNIIGHTSWLVDLEFGIPDMSQTERPVAIYDVLLNSIYCQNAPHMLHPDFENCNLEFKRMLLGYYQCVVRNWHRGYIITHNDNSITNFALWSNKAMRKFGMGWP